MIHFLRKLWSAVSSGSSPTRKVRDERATLARWAARATEDRYS